MPTKTLLSRRPAESAALAGAVAMLVARALGWADDPATVTALGVVIASMPAVVTGIVTRRRS